MSLYKCPMCHQRSLSSPWTDQASGMLPDDESTVLVALDDGEVCPAYYHTETERMPNVANGWLYVTGDPIESSRVLYWMPMPAHPDDKEAA